MKSYYRQLVSKSSGVAEMAAQCCLKAGVIFTTSRSLVPRPNQDRSLVIDLSLLLDHLSGRGFTSPRT